MAKNLTSSDDRSCGALSAQRSVSELFGRVDELFKDEQCYLNPDLKLEEICQRLHTSPSSLLKALKNAGFRNFSHFVNLHRIESAKRMLTSEAFKIYTLEAIAGMAGFGTRQAFYNAFEKLCGMKPARYRNVGTYGSKG